MSFRFQRSDERKHHGGLEHGSCMAKDLDWMRERFEELSKSGLNWDTPVLESANAPRVVINGKETIMLSANNYLNLSTHPRVVEASIEATRRYGAGSGSVRAIAGTMRHGVQRTALPYPIHRVTAWHAVPLVTFVSYPSIRFENLVRTQKKTQRDEP